MSISSPFAKSQNNKFTPNEPTNNPPQNLPPKLPP